ncbi:MAG: hypothetical protein HY717_22740 [Planctomycetes bacterium]|nr:hypothetical protein [Planctomycetota bacterium]
MRRDHSTCRPWRARLLAWSLAAGLLLPLAGCVERLLQIRSDPPGAEVALNGEPMVVVAGGKRAPAVTPVDIPFDFYGTFEITLRRPGCRSESRLVPVYAPFYQYPPLDFLVENCFPWRVTDARRVEFKLKPVPALSERETAALLQRMEELRSQNAAEEGQEPEVELEKSKKSEKN